MLINQLKQKYILLTRKLGLGITDFKISGSSFYGGNSLNDGTIFSFSLKDPQEEIIKKHDKIKRDFNGILFKFHGMPSSWSK